MVVLLVACLPVAGQANPGPNTARPSLSREFCGTFQWHGDPSLQEVFVSLSDIGTDNDGLILASGKGRYVAFGRTTYTDVQWQIDPKTERFEMLDSNPTTEEPDFIVDGSYIGTIDDGLTSIEATWTTRGSSEKGTLLLHACSTATSLLVTRIRGRPSRARH